MGFTKSVITATDITNTLKAWLRTSAGNAVVRDVSGGYGASDYLRTVAQDFVRMLISLANSYAASRGWGRDHDGRLIDIVGLAWGNNIYQAKAKVTGTNAATGATVVSVWLPAATDLLGKYSMNPRRIGYRRGVYDIIGLMTQGYTRDDRIVKPPIEDTSVDSVLPRSWTRSAKTVHYIKKPHMWGFERASFVAEAISQFELQYSNLGARVVGIPDTWK